MNNEEVVLTFASEIKEEKYDWIWEHRIPIGEIVMLCGMDGIGKGVMLATITAAVTLGQGLPGESEDAVARKRPGWVMWMATEDALGLVIKNRLVAAGADQDRVVLEGSPMDLDTYLGMEIFRRKLGALRNVMARKGEEDRDLMVITDPVRSFHKCDDNSYKEVGKFLDGLRALSDKEKLALTTVRHPAKSMGQGDSAAMILGSKAWRSTPRSVLLMGKDQSTGRLAIALEKTNIAIKAETVGYSIVSVGGAPKLEWTGIQEITSDDLINQMEREVVEGPGKLAEAKDHILKMLELGPAAGWEVLREGKGIASDKTIRKAKKELGILDKWGYSDEGKKVSYWYAEGTEDKVPGRRDENKTEDGS